MDFEGRLKRWLQMVEEGLRRFLPPEGSIPSQLPEAMRYSVFTGGKRIRPVLVLAACEAVGGDPSKALPFACALEMIHTYSLIHDDLPAMDDDDYRRGHATSHRVFGEAMAILAGDALLTEAFRIMASPETRGELPEGLILDVISEIARAAGVYGMVGGQAVDVEVEDREVDLKTVQWIHRHKTGALIAAAVKVGGKVGGATPGEMEALSRYGEAIGMAFQVVDDILDYGEEKKATYPRLAGLEEAKEEAKRLFQEAVEALDPLGERGEPLRAIARMIVERAG
ncbi:MAG TPA: polyprenyl synthetase family protein [Deltaproteobacteria bacterium]|nr:polyprenyl synthetase family protein [Deltaproteobacteria bacterium]